MHRLTESLFGVHAQLPSGASDMKFGMSLHLGPLFVCACIEDYGEISCICKLVLAFNAGNIDKYQNLMNWLISVQFHIVWLINCLSNAFIVVILLSLLRVQLSSFSSCSVHILSIFQLTVFHMKKHEDLDLAILSVLLKGKFTYSPTFVQILVCTF